MTEPEFPLQSTHSHIQDFGDEQYSSTRVMQLEWIRNQIETIFYHQLYMYTHYTVPLTAVCQIQSTHHMCIAVILNSLQYTKKGVEHSYSNIIGRAQRKKAHCKLRFKF